MRIAAILVTVAIVLLGLTHIGFTFSNYDEVSIDAAWFVGTGVAIVLAGFMNAAMLRDRSNDILIRVMTIVTNLVFLVGFGLATFMLPQPQVFLGTLLFAFATVYSLVHK